MRTIPGVVNIWISCQVVDREDATTPGSAIGQLGVFDGGSAAGYKYTFFFKPGFRLAGITQGKTSLCRAGWLGGLSLGMSIAC